MPHMPIKALVAEVRAKAAECLKRGLSEPKPHTAPVVVDPEAYAMAGWLANHADHVEALLNDYPEG